MRWGCVGASYEWGGVGLDGEDEVCLVACAVVSIYLEGALCTGDFAGRLTHVVGYAAPCCDITVSDYLKNDGLKGDCVSTDAVGLTLVVF